MRTWVVPCRFDPIVFECVESILAHHPDDRIVVVDSCSPDQTYLDQLSGTCDILTGNTNYTSGAYGMAIDTFESDYWCFTQDSLIVKQPLGDRLQELTIFQWFPPTLNDLSDWCAAERDRMRIPEERAWFGIFGTVFFCTDTIARIVQKSGWFDTVVPTKFEACGTERTLGMVFSEFGHPMPDSLAGQHTDRGSMSNEWVRKYFLDRQ
jgi:hypothetical protein